MSNNSALQLSTIFLGTTPAKGLVAVNQVPVFTGSDDDAEIENFNVIRSFCGSNMFAITNLYAPNPPAINYIVNCTTNNVTYYGIEVYAGLVVLWVMSISMATSLMKVRPQTLHKQQWLPVFKPFSPSVPISTPHKLTDNSSEQSL